MAPSNDRVEMLTLGVRVSEDEATPDERSSACIELRHMCLSEVREVERND